MIFNCKKKWYLIIVHVIQTCLIKALHWIEDRFCTLNDEAHHKIFEILDVHAGCQFN